MRTNRGEEHLECAKLFAAAREGAERDYLWSTLVNAFKIGLLDVAMRQSGESRVVRLL